MAPEVVRSVNVEGAEAAPDSCRASLRVGPVTLDAGSGDAWLGGGPLGLSAGEFSLFHALASRRNVVLTKESLAESLQLGSASLVDVFVWRVRAKLAQRGLAGLIATVWGRGYAVFDAAGPACDWPVANDPAPALALNEA